MSRRPAARLAVLGRPRRLAPLFARPLYVLAVLALVATSCDGTAPPPDGDPVAGYPSGATSAGAATPGAESAAETAQVDVLGPEATTPIDQGATHQPDTPLELWAVPGFAALEDEAGNRWGLRAALDSIARDDPRLEADVTLVPERGEAGIEALLSSTASAAPSALPDIVVLPLDSLEAAAAQGLIQPLPDTVPPDRTENTFLFARSAAAGDEVGEYRAVPFAVDVGHAIARDAPVPESWADAVEADLAFVVPSGLTPDAAALVGSAYLSAGRGDGESAEEIAADVARAIAPLAEAIDAGIVSGAEGGDSRAAWNSFLLDDEERAIVSASVFAPHQPGFPALTWGPLPTDEAPSQPPSQPVGWGWAFVVTAQDRERGAVAGELIARLTHPGELGWVIETDHLPASHEDWVEVVGSSLDPAPSDEYVEFAADLLAEADGLATLPGRWEDWAEVLNRLLSGESAEDAAAAIASE